MTRNQTARSGWNELTSDSGLRVFRIYHLGRWWRPTEKAARRMVWGTFGWTHVGENQEQVGYRRAKLGYWVVLDQRNWERTQLEGSNVSEPSKVYRPTPRSETRMRASLNPAEAAQRIIELETERDRLLAAVGHEIHKSTTSSDAVDKAIKWMDDRRHDTLFAIEKSLRYEGALKQIAAMTNRDGDTLGRARRLARRTLDD